MHTAMRTYGIAIAAAGVLAIAFTNTSNAFPALTGASAAAPSVPGLVTDARYVGRGQVRSYGGRGYSGARYGGRYYGRGYGGRYYGGGYGGRYYAGYGGRYYGGGYGYYGYGAAAAAGLVLGAAAINSGYYGYAPAYYYGGNCWIATDSRGSGYYGPCY
jgi:hypothetical protein